MADHPADDMPVQPVLDRRHGHIHRVRRLRPPRPRVHIGDRRDRAVLRGRQVLLFARIHGAGVGQPVQQRAQVSRVDCGLVENDFISHQLKYTRIRINW